MNQLVFAELQPSNHCVRALATDSIVPLGSTINIPPACQDGALGWVHIAGSSGTVQQVVTSGPGAQTDLYAAAVTLGVRAEINAPALVEASALCAAGIGDGIGRDDLSPLPFVTIDGPHSRDLDQALYIERLGNGYRVYYALADAAYFVKPGSALFAHALERGTSYYLPGHAFPMLPRELSEGLISLAPSVRRNALIVTSDLDAKGAVVESRIAEGIIRSRRQLTFGEVEEYLHGRNRDLVGTDFEDSLKLLREVGELLASQVEARGKIAFNRAESELVWHGDKLIAEPGVRRDSERYNEQLSLLANSEGGRLLFEGTAPWVHPIYRVHPAPSTERLVAFQRLTETLGKRSGCPLYLADDGASALSSFLREVANANLNPDLKGAVERQCLLLNERSFFSTEPKAHFGVAATPYARLSAPMREIVGIFLHKELRDLAAGQSRPVDVDGDIALRELVLEAGNRAKDLQSRLEGMAMETALQGTFPTVGAVYTGSIVGFSSSKLYVALHAEQIDVRVSYFDLAKAWGGGWLGPAPHGCDLVRTDNGAVVASLGDTIELVVAKRPNGSRGLVPTAKRARSAGR